MVISAYLLQQTGAINKLRCYKCTFYGYKPDKQQIPIYNI